MRHLSRCPGQDRIEDSPLRGFRRLGGAADRLTHTARHDVVLAAWIALAARRRTALLVASLPAWIGALAVFVGLEAVPLMLLALSTAVLFYLYRIPRQLG